MKILKISVSGLALFNGKCELDFMALNRVNAENAEKLNCVISNYSQDYYKNNVIAFIGINASGKTTVLKLITFVCRMLNNEPISSMPYCEIFDGVKDGEKIEFDIFFYAENKSVNFLHTIITKKDNKLIIKDEFLKSKSITKVKSKSDLFDFENCNVSIARNNDEAFLLDDVSIAIAC